MESELALLINKYLHYNNYDIKDFILESYIIIKKYYLLETKLKYNLNSSNEIAIYNTKSNTIYINNYFIKNYKNICDKTTNHDEKYYLLYTIRILLHEIGHANQWLKVQYQDSIEGHILKEEFNADKKMIREIKNSKEKILSWSNLYHSLYEYCPTERFTEIDALYKVINVSSLLNDEKSTLEFKYNYLKKILSGYDKFEEPTRHYIENINKDSNWQDILNMCNDLNLHEKTRMGLKTNTYYLEDLREKKKLIHNELKTYTN